MRIHPLCVLGLILPLAACYSEKERVVEKSPPTVVEHRTVVEPSTVNCAHGYDASTNTCY